MVRKCKNSHAGHAVDWACWGIAIVAIASSVSSISNFPLREKEEWQKKSAAGARQNCSNITRRHRSCAICSECCKSLGRSGVSQNIGHSPLSVPSAELPLYVRTVRTMLADFAARGRSGLKSRELHWSAPVELAAVQSSPWLQSGSYPPTQNKTKKEQQKSEPTFL